MDVRQLKRSAAALLVALGIGGFIANQTANAGVPPTIRSITPRAISPDPPVIDPPVVVPPIVVVVPPPKYTPMCATPEPAGAAVCALAN